MTESVTALRSTDNAMKPFKWLFNVVLSSVYHRPRVSIADVFTQILKTWVPPPANILDPTAGPRRMYKRVHGNETLDHFDYTFTFGDIEPQAKDVLQLDAKRLPTEWDKKFDLVVTDPPYNRNLMDEQKKIKAYKGDRDYNLREFIDLTAFEFFRVLKPNGHLIFKVGDNHRKVIVNDKVEWTIEAWHNYAIEAYCNRAGLFKLRDIVIHAPWHRHARWAPNRPVSMQRHSYFMLFQKAF